MPKAVHIPKEVLGAKIRAGRVTLGGMGGSATLGVLGKAAEAVAVAGLKKAGQAERVGAALQFPGCCCNCLGEGPQLRPVESASIVNRGVAYTFRFRVPHCRACAETAGRKRPGLMGMLAAFLAISVPIGIALLAAGAATNRDSLIVASFVVAPLAGLALPFAWARLRRARPGQASRYQAVFASSIDVGLSGVPEGFALSFENPAYAARFVALNKQAGVSEP